MLIGLDNAHLHQTLREVPGNVGQPIARLTPLGWTCIGNTGLRSNDSPSTRFVSTFFQNTSLEKIDKSIVRFWEVEESKEIDPMSVLEKEILAQTLRNMKYNKTIKKYEIGIPWKNDIKLPNNYPMALKRLQNTGKSFLRITI